MLVQGGLKRLLEDVNIRKLTHDCRSDSDILFHRHQVLLTNVHDSQLAHAILCIQNGNSLPLPIGLNRFLSKYSNGFANEMKIDQRVAMADDEGSFHY